MTGGDPPFLQVRYGELVSVEVAADLRPASVFHLLWGKRGGHLPGDKGRTRIGKQQSRGRTAPRGEEAGRKHPRTLDTGWDSPPVAPRGAGAVGMSQARVVWGRATGGQQAEREDGPGEKLEWWWWTPDGLQRRAKPGRCWGSRRKQRNERREGVGETEAEQRRS